MTRAAHLILVALLALSWPAEAAPTAKKKAAAKAPPSPLKGRLFVIDPGHGTLGFDGGVINSGKTARDGTAEHRLTMAISQKVGAELVKEGARVVYTRTPKDYWRSAFNAVEDNKARAQLANDLGGDAFLSFHCDWHPKRRVKGITTICSKESSRDLAETMQRVLTRELKAVDRKVLYDSYTVLDVAEVPAVIIETGFLSNPAERTKLRSRAYHAQIAKAVVKGLRRYYAAN